MLLFSGFLGGLRICVMESKVKSSFLIREPRDRVIECEVSSIGEQVSIEKIKGVFAFALHESFFGCFQVEIAHHIVSLFDSSVLHAVMISFLVGNHSARETLDGL